MRILLIADGRSPITRRWIGGLVALGYQVTLVTTFPCEPVEGVEADVCLPVAFAGMGGSASGEAARGKSRLRGLVSAFRPLFLAARYRLGPLTLKQYGPRLRWLVERIQPDVVHALRIPYEGMLGAYTPPGIPLAVSIWGNDLTLHANATGQMAALTRRALLRADGLHTDAVRDIRLARSWGFGAVRDIRLARSWGFGAVRDIRLARSWGFGAERDIRLARSRGSGAIRDVRLAQSRGGGAVRDVGLAQSSEGDAELGEGTADAREPETERPTLVVPGSGGLDLIEMDIVRGQSEGRSEEAPLIINPRGFRTGSVRQDTFFAAVPLVLERRPDVRFACAAMAGQREALEALDRYRLHGKVELLPHLPQQELWKRFAQSTLSLSISQHDGTPNSLLEAMALGAFPIAGDIESIREWITPGINGLLVEPSSPKALADAILLALGAPALRSQAAQINRQVVEARAEISVVRAKIAAFYEQLAGGETHVEMQNEEQQEDA